MCPPCHRTWPGTLLAIRYQGSSSMTIAVSSATWRGCHSAQSHIGCDQSKGAPGSPSEGFGEHQKGLAARGGSSHHRCSEKACDCNAVWGNSDHFREGGEPEGTARDSAGTEQERECPPSALKQWASSRHPGVENVGTGADELLSVGSSSCGSGYKLGRQAGS